ncbi:MAG: UpxY family transcription antiterminator [Dysgonamonadaceae bacterium]|jgi:transcription antitermination factor NusG|nr:UpxY family transcription antiterminator [Dysgonamonadaceae bacterium]
MNDFNWYAARVKYRTEKKIQVGLEERGIKHFIPFHKVMIERNGRKKKVEKPVIACLIFVYTDYQTALSLPDDLQFSITYMRNLETKRFLTVPEKQMQDFMFLLDLSSTTMRIKNEDLRRGDRVRVIKGDFAGIEGELIRIKGHKRVVVRLEGLFSLATTYIPSEYLEKIGDGVGS